MKELKDYLHLYLGCECKTPWGILRLTRFDIKDKYKAWFTTGFKENEKILYANGCIGKSFQTSSIKLILRPLSDLNDEELKCLRSERKHLRGVHRNDLRFIINLNTWSPEDIVFLLSKGFDLFGLIEAGLAIDKTTLK